MKQFERVAQIFLVISGVLAWQCTSREGDPRILDLEPSEGVVGFNNEVAIQGEDLDVSLVRNVSCSGDGVVEMEDHHEMEAVAIQTWFRENYMRGVPPAAAPQCQRPS